MANPIKYSTGSETKALKKGNFFIGTGDVGKGPSDVTGYYQGVDVLSGGYTIYLYNENSSSNLSYHVANNDEELISFTNGIDNQTFTSTTECISWINTQTGRVIFNKDFEPFITDGLVFYVDPSKIMSYITGNTSVYDVTNNYSGITQNGVSFSNENEGVWSFDGTDDNILFQNLNLSTTTGATFMFWSTNNSTDFIQSPFGYHRSYWSIRSSQQYLYLGWDNAERAVSFSNTGNGWRFLSITFNNGIVRFYRNNSFLSQTSGPSTITSFSTMYIGRRAFPSPYSYNGNIGNILIYNRPLSDEEIVYNYEATGKRFVSLEVQSLVVAGGGSGGAGWPGGGGGAGGLLTGYSPTLTINTNYTITVGAGGSPWSKGSDSVFNELTSIGGGRGGGGGRSGSGGSGGSGGGGQTNYPPDVVNVGYLTPAGLGTIGQGNDGGVGKSIYSDTRLDGIPTGAGGGGGAGSVGGTGTTTPVLKAGNGGVGLYFSEYSSLGGSPLGWFAGGGGGSTSFSNKALNGIGVGGNGGGGNGSQRVGNEGQPVATSGIINTGGGGGGAGYLENPLVQSSGGSGIVILRVPDVYTAKFSSGVSWSVTKSNGYKYYKVTATSTTSETVSFS
jgi:hypothetical protein